MKDGTPGTIGDQLLAHPIGVFSESFRSLRTALKLCQDDQLARDDCDHVFFDRRRQDDHGNLSSEIRRLLGDAGDARGLRLRHRSCSETFVSDSRFGLIDVLKGHARLEQAVVTDRKSGAGHSSISPGSESNFD